jgi:hypothetical protein
VERDTLLGSAAPIRSDGANSATCHI